MIPLRRTRKRTGRIVAPSPTAFTWNSGTGWVFQGPKTAYLDRRQICYGDVHRARLQHNDGPRRRDSDACEVRSKAPKRRIVLARPDVRQVVHPNAPLQIHFGLRNVRWRSLSHVVYRHTCRPQKSGHEFDIGVEPLLLSYQILIYGERMARGTLAGKKVCGGG